MKSSSWIRSPAVAGRFYPREEEKILSMLRDFLEPRENRISVPVIFAPHAGYIYSGAIAGEIYRRVNIPSTVIVLCPNHTGLGLPVSVWSEGAWETPLGKVEIDAELAQTFLALAKEKKGDQAGHAEEHAIEVQVPFLRYLRPEVRILPITLGPLRLEQCLDLGNALAETTKSRAQEDVLIVASTDMSHYISAEMAREKDSTALEAIETVQPDELYLRVVENEISMCGFIPTTVALQAARRLNATQGDVIKYGTSGDVTKDYRSVVAYAAGWIK